MCIRHLMHALYHSPEIVRLAVRTVGIMSIADRLFIINK